MHKLRIISLSLLFVATQQSFGISRDTSGALASFGMGLACASSDRKPNKSDVVATGLAISGFCALGSIENPKAAQLGIASILASGVYAYAGSLIANLAFYTAGYGIGHGLKQLSNRNDNQ